MGVSADQNATRSKGRGRREHREERGRETPRGHEEETSVESGVNGDEMTFTAPGVLTTSLWQKNTGAN